MSPAFGSEGLAALALVRETGALLAFDFDGTLAPIVRDASRAHMRPRTRRLLRAVALRYPCAIVTGRSVADVRLRFEGIPIRWFVGNHGAESPGRRGGRRSVPPSWGARMETVAARFRGAFVEDKGLSLAVHYRGAADRKGARAAIHRAAAGLDGARVVPGKLVVNLVPGSAPDKGEALCALVDRLRPPALLFAGDDETDEDVFRRDPGVPFVTIRVGRKRGTHARFALDGQGGMDRLLRELLKHRAGQEAREMTSSSSDSGVIETMQAIWALAHALEARSKWMQSEYGVTGPQRLLLRVLAEHPGASPGTVARQMWLDPGTVSRILKGLERLRLVERKRDPADGRRFRLELTPLGRSLNALKDGTVEAGIRRALGQMKGAEIQATLVALRRFTHEVMPPVRRRRSR